jgi:hypothetical protein
MGGPTKRRPQSPESMETTSRVGAKVGALGGFRGAKASEKLGITPHTKKKRRLCEGGRGGGGECVDLEGEELAEQSHRQGREWGNGG